MSVGLTQPIIKASGLAYIDEALIRDGVLTMAQLAQAVQDAIAAGGLTEAQVAAYLVAQHYATEARVNTLIANAIASAPSGSSPAYRDDPEGALAMALALSLIHI